MSEAMSLKARIRNLAKEKNIPSQVVLQDFMFERLLVWLAVSEYKDKFVLKGGMLVASIVGLSNRATMDLDATLKSWPLTPDAIRNALEQVCAIPMDDHVSFEIGTISPIREDDIYGGYRVSLTASFETILTPLTIDVSTGDVITPHAERHRFTEIFDVAQTYELWAYNIETILAEKVETILRRIVFNTRPRDFYDVYILATTQTYDHALFRQALQEIAVHRATTAHISDVPGILQTLSESLELQALWVKYRRQFSYAQGIEYAQIIMTIGQMLQNSVFKTNRPFPVQLCAGKGCFFSMRRKRLFLAIAFLPEFWYNNFAVHIHFTFEGAFCQLWQRRTLCKDILECVILNFN